MEAADEVMASCVIDFEALLGEVLYLVLESSVDGVTIFPATSGTIGSLWSDYLTLQDFVDAFVAWVNSDNTIPEYTATNVGAVVTLLPAIGLGASVNGLLANLLGNAIKFTTVDITTDLVVMTPSFGCYDYDRDEIWFAGYLSDDLYILDPNTNVITPIPIPGFLVTGDIVYNPAKQRKYISSCHA